MNDDLVLLAIPPVDGGAVGRWNGTSASGVPNLANCKSWTKTFTVRSKNYTRNRS